MRHRKKGYRLGRSSSHRLALRRNLINALFEHERITTTETKARAIRGEAERVITLAKRGLRRADMENGFVADAEHDARIKVHHAWSLVNSRINNKEMTHKVFDELAPRYMDRKGGYTRMLKLGPRHGDRAPMVLLELVEE